MNNPRVTVLMTAFNAGAFLDEAVRGILAQTFRDFEFLIVDDASTDGTRERLREWTKSDSRIRLILPEANQGQTACLNLGLREARGEWIARQDADDLSEPARLAELLAASSRQPDLSLIGSNGWVIDSAGRQTGTVNVPCAEAAIRWAMPFQNPFIHTAVLFRRGAFYDETFQICQDWEMWWRLSQHGRVANLRERLVSYRHHESSLSHAKADRTAAECREILKRMGVSAENVEPFRRGLRAKERREFWRYYHQRLKASPLRNTVSEAVALHHLQAAGSVLRDSKRAALMEILAAIRADWRYVRGFFRSRRQ